MKLYVLPILSRDVPAEACENSLLRLFCLIRFKFLSRLAMILSLIELLVGHVVSVNLYKGYSNCLETILL